MAEKTPVIYDSQLVEQVLDRCEGALKAIKPESQLRFEELTAEPGELPRFMFGITDSGEEESRYVSGERIIPLAFTLTLRIDIDDEKSRIDAANLLSLLGRAVETFTVGLDGYVAYRKPRASMPICLGCTEAFEDWQITVSGKYKELK